MAEPICGAGALGSTVHVALAIQHLLPKACLCPEHKPAIKHCSTGKMHKACYPHVPAGYQPGI